MKPGQHHPAGPINRGVENDVDGLRDGIFHGPELSLEAINGTRPAAQIVFRHAQGAHIPHGPPMQQTTRAWSAAHGVTIQGPDNVIRPARSPNDHIGLHRNAGQSRRVDPCQTVGGAESDQPTITSSC